MPTITKQEFAAASHHFFSTYNEGKKSLLCKQELMILAYMAYCTNTDPELLTEEDRLSMMANLKCLMSGDLSLATMPDDIDQILSDIYDDVQNNPPKKPKTDRCSTSFEKSRLPSKTQLAQLAIFAVGVIGATIAVGKWLKA